MESSPISLTWRDGQQLLVALGRRILIQGTALLRRSAETGAKLWRETFRKIPNPKSYPSHRACPACGEKTFYQASLSTVFTGLYTRSCSACRYCESRKVKMIRQL